MLIPPWDAAVDAAEWKDWLDSTARFGLLAVNHLDPTRAPLVLPTHFTLQGDQLLIHLARPNPVWPHLEAAAEVRMTVIGDYPYIPGYWRAQAGGPNEDGVPTSYYSTVQFVCLPTVVDDPEGKAEILAAQLTVLRVDAKFKYDDHKPVEHRQRVSGHLDQRGHGLDAGVAIQQRRRLVEVGEWQTHRDTP